MECGFVAPGPIGYEGDVKHPGFGHGVQIGICLESLWGPYALCT